jgi:hypothetical protein
MFPDSEHQPTASPIERRHLLVSGAVSFDLGLPKTNPDGGQSAVFAASVPEARIHEDNRLVFS